MKTTEPITVPRKIWSFLMARDGRDAWSELRSNRQVELDWAFAWSWNLFRVGAPVLLNEQMPRIPIEKFGLTRGDNLLVANVRCLGLDKEQMVAAFLKAQELGINLFVAQHNSALLWDRPMTRLDLDMLLNNEQWPDPTLCESIQHIRLALEQWTPCVNVTPGSMEATVEISSTSWLFFRAPKKVRIKFQKHVDEKTARVGWSLYINGEEKFSCGQTYGPLFSQARRLLREMSA